MKLSQLTTAALFAALTGVPALAQYSPAIPDLIVDDNPDVGSIDIAGGAGTTYTSFDLSFDWTAGGGSPWSSETIFALADGSDTFATTFHADPGVSPDALDSGDPVTLTWSGFLDVPYVGGDPLWFLNLQTFGGSDATWSNIMLELGTDTPTAPAATDLGLLGDMIMTTDALAPSSVNWYTFDTDGGDVSISTAGSILTDAGFGENDTELGLYDSTGLLIANNDDFGGDLTSLIEETLAAGTYYVAVGSFNTVFGGSAWDVTSDSVAEGTVKLTIVPEPASAALVAMGAMTVVGRRRRA